MANNPQNLVSFRDMSEEKQKEIASMGGKARAAAIQRRKTLKESLLILLEQDNNQDDMTIALFKEALKGNVKAFETIRDTIGEKPVEVKEIKHENNPLKELIESIDEIKNENK